MQTETNEQNLAASEHYNVHKNIAQIADQAGTIVLGEAVKLHPTRLCPMRLLEEFFCQCRSARRNLFRTAGCLLADGAWTMFSKHSSSLTLLVLVCLRHLIEPAHFLEHWRDERRR